MNRKEAKQKLEEAKSLIFEVERLWKEGEHPRIDGYRARIAIRDFQNELNYAVFADEVRE